MVGESFSGHYVNQKAVFDSVDRPALWLLLHSLGIPLTMVSLILELYTGTLSSVHMDEILSDWFEIRSSVGQGCTIAPALFLYHMDCILEHTVHGGLTGASLGDESVSDLDYANDVTLIADMLEVLIMSLPEDDSRFGLEINWGTTQIQTTVDSLVQSRGTA